MASAFTLTLAYLGEEYSAADAGRRVCRLHHGQCREQPDRPARSRRRSPITSGLQPTSTSCGAQPRRRRCWSTSRSAQPADPCRRWGRVSSPLATWRCILRNPPAARASASAFASCSPLSAPLPSSTSCLCAAVLGLDAARVRLFRLPAVDLHHAAGRPRRERFGTQPTFWRLWRSPASRCPCLLTPSLPAVLVGWCWWALAPSLHRRRPRALSAAPRPSTAGRRAASISPATSWVGWLAPPCWARYSIGSDGGLVSSGLRSF